MCACPALGYMTRWCPFAGDLQGLKLALVVAVPVSVLVGRLLEQRATIRALKFRTRYFEDKLDNVIQTLDIDQLMRLDEEIESDLEFFRIAKTSLKDTL